MLLKNIFIQYGYEGLLNENSSNQGINVGYFKEENAYPMELKEIYTSSTKDELFFVLMADGTDAQTLCDKWDRKISSFISFGSKKKDEVLRLKYNIVQIILYQGEIEKRELEQSLFISRKIFIPCYVTDKNEIELAEEHKIILPFVPVEQGNYVVDKGLINELKSYLPEKDELFFLGTEKKQVKRNNRISEPSLSFSNDEFEKIKGWLMRNDNTVG